MFAILCFFLIGFEHFKNWSVSTYTSRSVRQFRIFKCCCSVCVSWNCAIRDLGNSHFEIATICFCWNIGTWRLWFFLDFWRFLIDGENLILFVSIDNRRGPAEKKRFLSIFQSELKNLVFFYSNRFLAIDFRGPPPKKKKRFIINHTVARFPEETTVLAWFY